MWHKTHMSSFFLFASFLIWCLWYYTLILHEVTPQHDRSTLHLQLHKGSMSPNSERKTGLPLTDESADRWFQHYSFESCWGKVTGEILLVIACHNGTLIACSWLASSEGLLVHTSCNQGVSSSWMTKEWMNTRLQIEDGHTHHLKLW